MASCGLCFLTTAIQDERGGEGGRRERMQRSLLHLLLSLVYRGLEACLATTSATIRATTGATFPRPSRHSAHCTSTRLETARATPSHHPMRNWWTPLSPPAATHPQAPTPTSTTPTTLPWVASPTPPATLAQSALWRAMGLPCPLLSG